MGNTRAIPNHLSNAPGTFYGELWDNKPYNPEEIEPAVWAALPRNCTKIDLQFDDRYAMEAQNLLRRVGVSIPPGYRPLDVRHSGKEFSVKGYVIVEPNALMDDLLQVLPKDMGRGDSSGIKVYANGRLRIGSVFLGVCALKLGYRLHPRCKPSIYQKAEQRQAATIREFGSECPLFD